MNSVKIFEALGEVDDELVERADRPLPHQNRHEIVKRMLVIAACLALVVSLSIGGAMMMRDANKFPEDKPQEAPQDPPKQPDGFASMLPIKNFSSLDEFKAYINDKEAQEKGYKIDEGVYIDFDSIVSNSEIAYVSMSNSNSYSIYYIDENDFCRSFSIYVSKRDRSINADIECSTMDELRRIEQSLAYDNKYIQLKIENQNLLYSGDYRGLDSLILFVDNYYISFGWDTRGSIDDYLSSQSSFLSAVVPAYGATDDSVVDMVNRIKALIPQ